MDRIWRRDGTTTVREMLEDLRQFREIAYTTVMTTMDALYRKGWLDREKHGKAFHYWPTLTRDEDGARQMREALDSSDNRDAVLNHFIAQISVEESTKLQDLLRRSSAHKDAS